MNSEANTQFLINDVVEYRQPKSVSRKNDMDFERLVGKQGWNRLVPAIRARFSKTYDKAESINYKGSMLIVRSNLMGWALAQVARLLGTPLTPFSGSNVPTIVRVYENEDNTGTIWEREYQFPNRKPLIIRSTKMLDIDETLLESVDGGVRMRLNVFEEDGRLIFLSTSYFIKILNYRIRVPALLTPGVTRVEHIDEGNGFFRFVLSMKHPYLGEMFYQEGIFR